MKSCLKYIWMHLSRPLHDEKIRVDFITLLIKIIEEFLIFLNFKHWKVSMNMLILACYLNPFVFLVDNLEPRIFVYLQDSHSVTIILVWEYHRQRSNQLNAFLDQFFRTIKLNIELVMHLRHQIFEV